MSFSERYGYKPIKNAFQTESVDAPLRNGLWSLLKIYCWDHTYQVPGYSSIYLNSRGNEGMRTLCQRIWFSYFKEPLDHLSNDWSIVLGQLREHFFGCRWNEVYDFVEFLLQNCIWFHFEENFTVPCNQLLEREMSAYRIVKGVITRITEEHQITEIEQAIENSSAPVRTHLYRSLELLADRSNPDYRNSIKESISAVESQVSITTKNEKGTLGQLIKQLEDKIELHPALKAAFGSLYGYTSDEGGIRHALTEVERVDFNDAKFMLVVCSAFINFVEGKLHG